MVSIEIQLRHLSGSLAGHSQGLVLEEGQTLLLGRHPSCDLKFHQDTDDAVSAFHARLSLVGGRLFLEDQRSSNGTFLGGARCAPFERLAVPDGGRIRLAAGGPELQVLIEGGSKPASDRENARAEIELAEIELAGEKDLPALAAAARRRSLMIGLAGLALLVTLAAGGLLFFYDTRRASSPPPPVPVPSWVEVEARVRPTVARVLSRYRVTAPGLGEIVNEEACGSGVLVQPTLVLTSAHLVRPWRDALAGPWDEVAEPARLVPTLETLSVQLPGQEPVPATLFALAGDADLALLQIPLRPTPPLALAGAEEALKVAQEVAFLLHPVERGRGAATWAAAPTPLADPLYFRAFVARIEPDAAGRPAGLTLDRSFVVGGGGGPLLNRRGELVGLILGRLGAAAEISLAGRPRATPSYELGTVEAVPLGALRRFLSRAGVIPADPTAP